MTQQDFHIRYNMASLADAKRVISDIRKDLDADNPEDDVKTKTLANAMEVSVKTGKLTHASDFP